jgi:hypothetical protein
LGKGLFDRLQSELEAREKSPGLVMSDLLTLPDALRDMLNWMIRQDQVAFADVAACLGQDEPFAREILAGLLDKGLLREIEIRGVTHYRVRLAPKRGRALPPNLWQALDDKVEHGEEEQ